MDLSAMAAAIGIGAIVVVTIFGPIGLVLIVGRLSVGMRARRHARAIERDRQRLAALGAARRRQ